MCAEEVSFAERSSQNGALLGVLAFESIDEDVALSDAHPWRTPHIKRHAVVALCGEVGSLDGLDAVRTATCTHHAVACNDVESPQALVVHIRRLKSSVAGVSHRHCHVLVYRRLWVDCVLWLTVEEVAA